VLHDCRDQKRKALETSEVTLQALCEGLKKFEIKHPNFGGPSTSQSFLWKILQINELTPHFSSCSVVVEKRSPADSAAQRKPKENQKKGS
jgi:hypothetical protein